MRCHCKDERLCENQSVYLCLVLNTAEYLVFKEHIIYLHYNYNIHQGFCQGFSLTFMAFGGVDSQITFMCEMSKVGTILAILSISVPLYLYRYYTGNSVPVYNLYSHTGISLPVHKLYTIYIIYLIYIQSLIWDIRIQLSCVY